MSRPVVIRRRGRGNIFDLFVKASQKILLEKKARRLFGGELD